jgi:penicillin-binding protein 1A
MNAASARLHLTVGPARTVALARRLGIRSELRPDASLALGTSEVSLLELTQAYGVLARDGRALEPYLIWRVRSSAGKLLWERTPEAGKTLVAPATAAAMSEMLRQVVTSGTGKRAQLAEYATAGKTGTSQDFRDAWFVGYTGHRIAGVWVGNDDARPMRRVTGGNLPARLWHDVMTLAHQGLAARPLPGSQGNERAAFSGEHSALGPAALSDPAQPAPPALGPFPEPAAAPHHSVVR